MIAAMHVSSANLLVVQLCKNLAQWVVTLKTSKNQKPKNWGVGPCTGMGACPGQYGTCISYSIAATKLMHAHLHTHTHTRTHAHTHACTRTHTYNNTLLIAMTQPSSPSVPTSQHCPSLCQEHCVELAQHHLEERRGRYLSTTPQDHLTTCVDQRYFMIDLRMSLFSSLFRLRVIIVRVE